MQEPAKPALVFETTNPDAIQRLIREVEGNSLPAATAYNRTYNRHNR
jgi:hypothetical protein